jgi:hypothetical protein
MGLSNGRRDFDLAGHHTLTGKRSERQFGQGRERGPLTPSSPS